MITYINEKNARDYEVLFSKATDILSKEQILGPDKDLLYVPYEGNGYVLRETFMKNPGDFYVKNAETGEYEVCTTASQYDINTEYYVENYPDITTLEKYFSVLGELLKIDGGDQDDDSYETIHSQGRRFTMLPLDEDVFEVNANTREISVPETFRRYGVGVQGDDLAEVVYFKIDRFFDATDLDTCDCYIQWEAPSREIGVSVPWVIDIESDPNKMIIGWVLSKRITSEPGNVKFSLRFFKHVQNELGEKELIFSYGTLASTAPIKSTLTVDMSKVEDNTIFKEYATDRSIVNRIANSHTKVTNVTPVNDPAWNDPTVTKTTYFDLDPNMDWSEDDKGAVVLRAQAHSTDGGIITYEWRKIAEDGGLGYPVSDIEYVAQQTTGLTAEEARSKGIVLYERQATDPVSYKIYDKIDELTDDIVKTLFTKDSVCKVGAVGTYVAAATNRKGFSTKTVASEKYIVPGPEPFTVSSQYARSYVLPVDNTGVILELDVAQNDGKYPNEAGGHGAVLSYQWSKDGAVMEGEAAEVQDLKVTEPGWYAVTIANTRNEATIEESLYRTFVAYPATPAQLSYPLDDHLTKDPSDETIKYILVKYEKLDQEAEKDKFKVIVDKENWGVNEFVCGDMGEVDENDGEVKGSLTYQWYQVAGNPDTPKNPESDEDDILIEGATESTFNPIAFEKDHGNFYCKITNTLINGSTAVAYSPLFFLMANN